MILEMHDICKDYPMGKSVNHILKHIDLEVEEGEYLAIMGPSGSGKTTLMNLIGCLDVTTCNNKQLAEVRNKELGFVFQSFNLLPKLTAVENVALPLLYGGVKKAERLERARQALETVGLSDRVDHRPDQLSGGQCQRVAIARAIVGRPKLLLADEPTGALDSASGAQVMDLFQQLHQSGSTIIMITHDQGIAQHAHTIMNIRDGVLSGGAFHE
jgi:putative ABC transport system ATP-binding protein